MKFKELPNKIAVFPLSNAIFFPRTLLPLNIFEDRYLQLVNDCIKNRRIFGMIQPKRSKNIRLKNKAELKLYQVGCLGRITNFNETEDNRLIITLYGLSRFKIIEEVTEVDHMLHNNNDRLNREFNVDYSNFINDIDKNNLSKTKIDIKNFISKAKLYFNKNSYSLDWNMVEQLDHEQLINIICMIAPLSVEEKQKLLEALKIKDKLDILNEILNFDLQSKFKNETIQ